MGKIAIASGRLTKRHRHPRVRRSWNACLNDREWLREPLGLWSQHLSFQRAGASASGRGGSWDIHGQRKASTRTRLLPGVGAPWYVAISIRSVRRADGTWTQREARTRHRDRGAQDAGVKRFLSTSVLHVRAWDGIRAGIHEPRGRDVRAFRSDGKPRRTMRRGVRPRQLDHGGLQVVSTELRENRRTSSGRKEQCPPKRCLGCHEDFWPPCAAPIIIWRRRRILRASGKEGAYPRLSDSIV